MAKKSTLEKIQIKLVRSLIGSTKAQISVAKGLGLTKTNQVVEHFNSPTIMGMVNKIPHLVKVEE